MSSGPELQSAHMIRGVSRHLAAVSDTLQSAAVSGKEALVHCIEHIVP